MSFRLKTVLGIAVIEAITLSILIWTSLNFLRTSNETAIMERASTTALMFATMTTDAVISFDLASLDSFVEELLKNPGIVYGRVISNSEGVLAQGGDPEVVARPFVLDTDFRSIADSVYDVESAIRVDGKIYGVVQVGLSVKALQGLLGTARTRITILAFGEIALTAFFSIILGLWLTRQLASLSEGSRQISKGNLGYQIPVRGKDELARTAITFNSMSLNLRQSYRQLNSALRQARQTSRKLSLSEAKMRAVLDGAVDGIITIDENGTIESFNPAAETIFGYAAREIIGRNVSLLVPEPHKSRHGDYILRYLNTGEAKIIGIGREVEGEHKNGGRIPLEIGISEIKIGEKRLFTGITRDVSERKRTEEELRRYRENLEQLVEERTQELKDVQQKLVEQAFESGRAELAAMMLHNIGNAVTPFSSQIDALRDGLPDHVIIYLERSYEELVAHQDRLHDYVLNDPRGQQVFAYIGELIAYLKRFKDHFDNHLEKITASLDYVGDILSLQQNYELGKRENRQLTDVNGLIEKALKIQQKRLEKCGITVSTELDADLPKLLVDPNRLMQVIVNVIKNACEAIAALDAADAPKRIHFRTSADNDAVTIQVADTGIGIEPDQIQNVYERGVSRKGSTGFGLYFSKMFMEKSNGKLVMDSPGIGRGTTLKLILKRRRATEMNGWR